MLFAISISVLGSALGYRTFLRMIERDLFLRSELIQTSLLCVLSQFLLLTVLTHTRLNLWIALFAPLIVAYFVLSLVVRSRSRSFRQVITESLSMIALKMRSGRSFRQALAEVTNESAPLIRKKWNEINSAVVFSQQSVSSKSDVFVQQLICELIRIDQTPHLAGKRLSTYRERLRIEDDFRRRSGQVLSRIRAQSLIMSMLFLSMEVFIAIKFGFSSNVRYFTLSTCLFACGALWIWFGGRKMKWKV